MTAIEGSGNTRKVVLSVNVNYSLQITVDDGVDVDEDGYGLYDDFFAEYDIRWYADRAKVVADLRQIRERLARYVGQKSGQLRPEELGEIQPDDTLTLWTDDDGIYELVAVAVGEQYERAYDV